VKGRSGTKPGSILKRQIPIRTFTEWNDLRPGFCEVDLVSHDGGDHTARPVKRWISPASQRGGPRCGALRNKAQRWCLEALADISRTLPFELLGLDSDNGSEFINKHLFVWCEQQAITFTRSRPYCKNDNCFVEQKNWPVVRH
jgi:hypothetical protein